MNSRERVRKVLNHEIPDRIPIDLGSTRTTGISTIAYNRLKERTGFKKDLARMYDFVQQLAYPEKEIRELFKVDIIDAGQAFLRPPDAWKKFGLNDGSECLIPKTINLETDSNGDIYIKNNSGLILGVKPSTSLYADQSFWVYGDKNGIPENINEKDLNLDLWAETSPPPGNLDIFIDKEFKVFVDSIKDLYEQTDYSICLRVGGNQVESGFSLRGMENYLCDLYLDKKGVNRLLDKLMEEYMKKIEKIIESVGKYVDILMFADDMGGQDGPLISPEIYREMFKHRHKEMWDYIHEKSNCKIFFHCCGSIAELLPDLIEAGIDILNPVQTTAKGMGPEKLKREFGKYIIFHGGCCNTSEVLARGSLKEVEEDVKKRISVLGTGGGLIFNQIHNILADVPPENIIKMFESAYKYGQYK
jgi:uroporphyrinogen decarboxylase